LIKNPHEVDLYHEKRERSPLTGKLLPMNMLELREEKLGVDL
jgi:hypothetical protein